MQIQPNPVFLPFFSPFFVVANINLDGGAGGPLGLSHVVSPVTAL